MLNSTKIRLSSREMDLLKNAEWILTKNAVMQKAFALLEEVQQQIWPYKKVSLSDLSIISPKISKGDNYEGLPWLMLDYPRNFEKENIFAIRCFFWWGNYFSITLHLSGNYKKRFEKKLLSHHSFWQKNNYYISNSDAEWTHAVTAPAYTPITNFSAKDVEIALQERSFVKLVKVFSFDKWDTMPALLAEAHQKILDILEN